MNNSMLPFQTMISNKWDLRFIKLSQSISTWSKDDRKQVGAIIVDNDKRIISTGYNGLPKGVKDSSTDNNEKLSKTLHAEVNAILFSKRDLKDTTIYISTLPVCSHCAAIIIQSGIRRVVCEMPSSPSSKWYKPHQTARDMLKESGVMLSYYYIINDEIFFF